MTGRPVARYSADTAGSGEALVLPGASADPLEFCLEERRLLDEFHQAVMAVVEDDGGADVPGLTCGAWSPKQPPCWLMNAGH